MITTNCFYTQTTPFDAGITVPSSPCVDVPDSILSGNQSLACLRKQALCLDRFSLLFDRNISGQEDAARVLKDFAGDTIILDGCADSSCARRKYIVLCTGATSYPVYSLFFSDFCAGGDMSTSLSALSVLSPVRLSVSGDFFHESSAARIAGRPDCTLLSSSVPLIRVPGHDGMRSCARSKHGTAFAEGFAFFSVTGSLCDAGWRFLSSSVAITVAADWMHARSCFSFSRTASAKFERFRAVAAFRSVHPSMERVLRL